MSNSAITTVFFSKDLFPCVADYLDPQSFFIATYVGPLSRYRDEAAHQLRIAQIEDHRAVDKGYPKDLVNLFRECAIPLQRLFPTSLNEQVFNSSVTIFDDPLTEPGFTIHLQEQNNSFTVTFFKSRESEWTHSCPGGADVEIYRAHRRRAHPNNSFDMCDACPIWIQDIHATDRRNQFLREIFTGTHPDFKLTCPVRLLPPRSLSKRDAKLLHQAYFPERYPPPSSRLSRCDRVALAVGVSFIATGFLSMACDYFS